jgi:hypothetical protein
VETIRSVGIIGTLCQETYNKPTNVLSVDIEAELNAGHVVEPERGIQLCAIAVGTALRSVKRKADFFNPPILCFRLLDESNVPPVDIELPSAIV